MKLPNNKIEACVSQGKGRYSTDTVKLDVAAKKLVATDGHILAAVPVQIDETDHSGLLGVHVVKAVRNMAKREKFNPTVSVNGSINVIGVNEKAEYATAEGTFPNWENAIPKVKGKPTISFDVNLLVRLADALRSGAGTKGVKHVSLWIRNDVDAILVKSTESEDSEAIGVMMPVNLQNKH